MATRAISSGDVKKIMKEIHRYRSSTEKEIRQLNVKITRLQKMMEKNIISEDSPDAYEIKAIKDFESKKKRDSKFLPLNSLN